MIEADWKLIEPYLQENEKLFGITIERLLTVDGEKKPQRRLPEDPPEENRGAGR